MFAKIITLCAVVAISSAVLLPSAVHYSPAEAVSSQSIVRHDQQHAAPLAKLALAAPVAYHAAPASIAYHAAPAHYSSAAAVSSQNIVRHDESSGLVSSAPKLTYAAPAAKLTLATPVAYHAAPAQIAYHSAPAPIAYHAAPAPIAYHTAPVAKIIAQPEEVAYPKYEYTYSVADGHTGDNKQQQESRDGDVVKGSYSFHEADGSIRTVEYTADDHNGFNAVVHNTAPTAAPAYVKAAPVVVKTPVYSAPALQYYHH
nr:cuticle protein-like [Vanessa tameamea]